MSTLSFTRIITAREEYDAANRVMLEILEAVENGDSTRRDEYELLSLLCRDYCERTYPSLPTVKSHELLAFLMEQNGLKQRDLAPLIGDKTLVSAVLAGRRRLTPAACAKLKERFAVDFAAIVGREVMEAPARRVRRPALKTRRAKRPGRKA